VVLRPAVELAFLYGRITRGINLTAASPEESVVGKPRAHSSDPWIGG